MASRRRFSASQTSQSSHMAKKNGGSKDLCLKCKKVVDDDEKGLCCQKCHNWFHSQCLNMLASEYKILQKYENLMWFCNECKQTVNDLLGQLSQKLEKTDKSIESLSDKMDKILDKLEEKCSRGVVKDMIDEVVEHKIEQKIEAYMNEREERGKRKRNLMLFNVPESKDKDVDQRIDFDKVQAESVLGKINEDQSNNIVVRYPRRFGKQGEKARPLRVTLESQEQLGRLLKKSKDLKTVEVGEDEAFIPEVVISPDLTAQQREERRVLVEELKERRGGGERNLKIFRGKIVGARETRDRGREAGHRGGAEQAGSPSRGLSLSGSM